MSILDAIKDAKQFKSRDDFTSSASKNYVRSKSEESNDLDNCNLYKQAKMIQRSRTIGTGLSKRRRQILSKRLKRVQIKIEDTQTQIEQTHPATEPLKEDIIPEKPESILNENLPTNNVEGKSVQQDWVQTPL